MFPFVVLFLFVLYMEIKYDWKWRYPERTHRKRPNYLTGPRLKPMPMKVTRNFLR